MSTQYCAIRKIKLLNINEFVAKQNENNGYMRTNRFSVRMTAPPILIDRSNAARDIEFYCESTELPGYQMMTHDVRRWSYGPAEKRPFAPNFVQAALTMNVDGNMTNWTYFNDWIQAIIPHDRGDNGGIGSASQHGNGNKVYELSYKKEYATDVLIDIYRTDGTIIRTTKLIEAFPSNINAIPVSWVDNNQIAQFVVYLDYLDWDVTQTPDQQNFASQFTDTSGLSGL